MPMSTTAAVTRSDWYRFAGISLFTMTTVLWMGHYLAHLMFTPF